MKVVERIEAFQKERRGLSGSIGFVPTMGALHVGHQSLIEASREACDLTVVSIYVNPTQFDNQKDLDRYPDTLEADLQLADRLGADYVITPGYDELYPDGFCYSVDESAFSRELCGAHRPGHFKGVLTVVMKLLNIVRPDCAYFGEKDFQQLSLIQGMVDAFFLDTRIVGCPTVRECDGLAFSSRNLNLSEAERLVAPRLHEILVSERDDQSAATRLRDLGFDVDYLTRTRGRRLVAAKLGKVRLIDNVALTEVAQ